VETLPSKRTTDRENKKKKNAEINHPPPIPHSLRRQGGETTKGTTTKDAAMTGATDPLHEDKERVLPWVRRLRGLSRRLALRQNNLIFLVISLGFRGNCNEKWNPVKQQRHDEYAGQEIRLSPAPRTPDKTLIF